MSKIIAKGIYLGRECVAECFIEDGSVIIEIDGEYDKKVQKKFNELLKNCSPIGGTYHPPKNSLLAGYSVLENSFFDIGSNPEINVEGEIETIPTYDIENIIY
ncbi:hypothetical protein SDC9_200343 [bioreactor metagenome]|uniref:Uncharacterized protein n=1 Tax=bioreactor metagenome TaxID=1076179 RepID=A0A645IN02_9ZZZZ